MLLVAVLQVANHPHICNVRQQLADTISIKFNLQQKNSDNVYVLHARIARLLSYVISVLKAMIATLILAGANTTARKPWGHRFVTTVAKLRLVYTYDHTHNATLVAAISWSWPARTACTT